MDKENNCKKISDFFRGEFRRVVRVNDLLEEEMSKKETIENEPEQILNNITALYKIADMIAKFD